jgi:hypothetical protein
LEAFSSIGNVPQRSTRFGQVQAAQIPRLHLRRPNDAKDLAFFFGRPKAATR